MRTRRKLLLATESRAPGTVAVNGRAAGATVALWPDPAGTAPARVAWFACALRTDRGRVRDANEDSIFALVTTVPRGPGVLPMPCGFFAIADGMGGLAEGAAASSGVIRQVTGQVVSALLAPALGAPQVAAQATVPDLLSEALAGANARLYRQARQSGRRSGTTFSGAIVLGRQITIAHIGDSRVYLYGPGGLRRLTQDHSVAGRLLELGRLDAAELHDNPQRNVLYRYLGLALHVEIQTAVLALDGATHLVLCTDGLWDVMGDVRLAEVLATAPTVDAAADCLVNEANARGGPDNISVIVVRLS